MKWLLYVAAYLALTFPLAVLVGRLCGLRDNQ